MLYRRRYSVVVSLTLSVLSGGVNALFESRDAKLQAVKTVGVICAIGDQFSFTKAGLTGPDTEPRRFAIPSWGLDDMVVQQTSAALSARFQVRPVTYQRSAFAAISESPLAPVNLVRGDQFKKLVQAEVSPQGLDAYVVITKARASFGGSTRKLEGVGLLTFSALMESFNQLYALYEIRVIDGKTFDIIEKMAAAPLDNTAIVRIGGPSRPVDDSLSLDITGAPDETLHRAIADLIARSLAITLADMHLVAEP